MAPVAAPRPAGGLVPRPMEAGFRKLRTIVSKKKRRFIDGPFDLDLAYVTDRIIAMGAPCQGVEAVFRNPLSQVRGFFDTRHAGHYKVFNLCSERHGDVFAGFPRVEHYPMDDHNPCPLHVLAELCASIGDYLAEDPRNVVAVHCKAGKGRTGLAVAAYLLHSGQCSSASEALALFAARRTLNDEGVTIPSQIRYVHYYGALLREGHSPAARVAPAIQLTGVRVVAPPAAGLAPLGARLYFKLKTRDERGRAATAYRFRPAGQEPERCCSGKGTLDMDCTDQDVFVRGDVRVSICASLPGGRSRELCGAWFDTRFCGQDGVLRLSKAELDGASKDAKHKRFAAHFEVHVRWREVAGVADECFDFQCLRAKTLVSTVSDVGGSWAESESEDSSTNPFAEFPTGTPDARPPWRNPVAEFFGSNPVAEFPGTPAVDLPGGGAAHRPAVADGFLL